MNIDDIKIELKNRYNKAVNFYRANEFNEFFSNIRVAIEYLAQLMLYEIIDNDDEFITLLNSDRSTLIKYGKSREIKGKDYLFLVSDVYKEKKRNINGTSQSDLRWLQSNCTTLAANYNLASKSLHSSIPLNSKLDLRAQANRIAFYFEALFNEMENNNIFSNGTVSFLLSLDSFVQKNSSNKSNAIAALTELNQIQEQNLKMSKKEILETKEENSKLESEVQKLLAENDELKRKHTSELQEKDQLLDQINHKYEKSIREKEEAEQIAFDALSENERLKKLNDSDKPSILTSNTRTRNTENNENNAPRLTDPMLVKAWTLSNSELTTKEIIEKSRWRPINAYERLTKLVLKGCFDAKRYMDEDTYNLVMNSIKKFGSKADVHDIQNNCGRGISLWHVNMVLAELKYNKIVIKSPAEAKPSRIVETQIKDLVVDNVTQSLFENYVVNCFRIQYRKCFTRKPSNAILKEPEIVIELTAYGKVTTFAVATWFEQKVNTTFTLEWDYLSVYRKYSKKIDGGFYFVLGKGGTPQQPKKIYILPLSIFKKDTPVNLTSTYKAENVSGSFRYDMNSGKLTLE